MGSFHGVEAQEKKTDEKEKELLMQEAIEQQKKAMVEQQSAQAEKEKIIKEKQVVIEKAMEDYESAMDNGKIRIFSERGNRAFSTGEPFIYSAPNIEFFGHSPDNSERTSWEFSKSVKETSFSRDYTFDVEPTVSTVVMSVNGDCKAGEIRIKIVMPNGKVYSDIVLDEFGNLNWRKSFNISDTENKDKAGAWKYEISSSKATGYFKISLQTY